LIKTHGFGKPLYLVAALLTNLTGPFLVGLALKTVPLGTAYAVWVGIGALVAFVVGVIMFGESLSLPRMLCVALILCGAIGLKMLESPASP
jgi:quaternary ammonium compound-resistance protein SugE